MQNELNLSCTEYNKEHTKGGIEQLLEKQDYLDYIDADMEAFYSIKAERYETIIQ